MIEVNRILICIGFDRSWALPLLRDFLNGIESRSTADGAGSEETPEFSREAVGPAHPVRFSEVEETGDATGCTGGVGPGHVFFNLVLIIFGEG